MRVTANFSAMMHDSYTLALEVDGTSSRMPTRFQRLWLCLSVSDFPERRFSGVIPRTQQPAPPSTCPVFGLYDQLTF